MIKYRYVLLFFSSLFFTAYPAQAQEELQSPDEFLGYELGEQWTPHHKVLDYFSHVAEHSPLVELEQYGETNEGRELVIVTVAGEENRDRIEEIRENNLRRTGLIDGEVSEDETSIVWLSYNVHGNETSSSEAALKTIYELVRADNQKTKKWLKNTVVIIDPMLNPDGRERYINWYNSVVGDSFNPDPDAREHQEPWPGGRSNHFYFDLNRDWAWLTQKESRWRLVKYQEWMPHIHVDFHEQSYNAPYYFAPAAEPFHQAITDWQRDFQHTIGENHAHYFDQNNWLYFTRQVFDLFYPSYGDTYPTFNGSIGMTYEQAGGGAAGLGIITAEEDTLTLHDRLIHHHTTGLSTVEVASGHAAQIVQEFTRYFRQSTEDPEGEYKTFVIKGDNKPAKIQSLLTLLDRHQIEYENPAREQNVEGYNYATGEVEQTSLHTDDYIINTRQPKSVLARVLFEPRPVLSDSLTYDITAWEQHYAYGLEGYALENHVEGDEATAPEPEENTVPTESPYAYLAEWNSFQDVRFLSRLLREGIKLRYAEKPFTVDGKEWAPGTLIITRTNNRSDEFDETVTEVADEAGRKVHPVSSGFVDSGADFGSREVPFLKAPNVALLSGSGTSSYMVGEIWHFFERQIDYPITLLAADQWDISDMDDYDVFILPDGSYSDLFSDETALEDLQNWIADGGKLIAVGEANGFLTGKEGFALKEKDPQMEENSSDADTLNFQNHFGESSRENISEMNSGAVYRISMDTTHPLAFGYDEDYFSLKLNADAYRYLSSGWNVGVAETDAHMSGFTGYKAKENLKETLTFGVEEKGNGSVVYLIDNPLFRGFWYNGKLLFSNAVFFN